MSSVGPSLNFGGCTEQAFLSYRRAFGGSAPAAGGPVPTETS